MRNAVGGIYRDYRLSKEHGFWQNKIAVMGQESQPTKNYQTMSPLEAARYRQKLRKFRASIAEDEELRARLEAGDEKPKEVTSGVTYGIGCLGAILGFAALCLLIFSNSLSTRIWTVVGGYGLMVIFYIIAKYFDKRALAKALRQPTARERVAQKCEECYIQFQELNPGKRFMNTATEPESRESFRIWWEKEYGWDNLLNKDKK